MTEHAIEVPADAAPHAHPSYVKIWVILLGLLVVSVLGPMLEIPAITLITAFGIAIVKAYLVVRYFMHVNVEPRYIGFMLATMLGAVLLFFAGVAPDVMRHDGQQWTNLAAEAEVQRVLGSHGGAVTGPAEEAPFEAAREFGATCGACHGATGAGDGPAAASLDPHPANFTEAAFWETRDREHVARVIREGGAAVGRSRLMPSFGSRYDDAELAALADYVAGLAPAGALAAAPADAGVLEAPAADAGVAAEPASDAPTTDAPTGVAPAAVAPATDAPAAVAPTAVAPAADVAERALPEAQ